MPGMLPSLTLDPSTATAVVVEFSQIAAPSLICRADDRRCVACNVAFEQLTGSAHAVAGGYTLDDFVAGPTATDVLTIASDVLLRRADSNVRMTMLPLPVIHLGSRAYLCTFLPFAPRDWRNCDLAHAIDEVIRDDMGWFSGAVMERLARRRPSASAAKGLSVLTGREREVLKLVCEGRGDADIANALSVTRNTLRNHLANIYVKAGVSRRSDAVVWGRDRGIASLAM